MPHLSGVDQKWAAESRSLGCNVIGPSRGGTVPAAEFWDGVRAHCITGARSTSLGFVTHAEKIGSPRQTLGVG